jgi:hypothetical protein
MGRLDEIKEREGKATKGPWLYNGNRYIDDVVCGNHDMICTLPYWNITVTQQDRNNAEYIAHSREDIPYLLERLQAAEKALTLYLRNTEPAHRDACLAQCYFDKWERRPWCTCDTGGKMSEDTCFRLCSQSSMASFVDGAREGICVICGILPDPGLLHCWHPISELVDIYIRIRRERDTLKAQVEKMRDALNAVLQIWDSSMHMPLSDLQDWINKAREELK